MNKKLRNFLIDSLGVVTTGLCIVIIYFTLFVDGNINAITKGVIIQAIIMAILTLLVKNFWYLSAENHIRNGAKYIETREALLDKINDVVVDRYDFDIFVDNENVNNYNLYVENHCHGLTPGNYKPWFIYRVLNRIRPIFGIARKSNEYYLRKYVDKIERRATRIHKLSSSNILTLSSTYNGLNDDRNNANAHKATYLVFSTLASMCTTVMISMISFRSKEDYDKIAAIVTMLLYCANILFAILQTVAKAIITVSKDDFEYFSRISNIIDKYSNYKENPVMVEKISYDFSKENKNASAINTTETQPISGADDDSGRQYTGLAVGVQYTAGDSRDGN